MPLALLRLSVNYTHQLASNSRQKKYLQWKKEGEKTLTGVALNFTPGIESTAYASQVQSGAWTAGAEEFTLASPWE